ncbi:MAG: AMP-binding protein [Deltaproteobacteria bacterium]
MTTLSTQDARQVTGGDVAIVDGSTYRFETVADHVRLLASGIRAAVRDGERAALVGHPRVDTILRALAAIELGVPLVMLHPRWTWTERERFRVLHNATAIDDVEPATTPVSLGAPIAPDTTLAIFATSGSSGAPKGVAISRGAFIAAASASAANLGWRPGDRWHLDLPLAHVGGFSILVRCLLGRRAVTLGPLEAIDTLEPSIVSVVPTQLDRLLREHTTLPKSLRAILLGGASAPRILLQEAASRGWPVLTTYGLTEASAQVATQRYGTPVDPDGGVGPPISGVDVRIENDEILVRGPTLMLGYTTGEPSPIVDGWLHTRDAGWLDDEGRLHVLGRRDGVLVTGGENVHPFEVEEALRALAGVTDAVVFGVDDATWGTQIVAALIGRRPSREELTGLARFKHPRRIAMVEAFATNATGKIDRAAVAKNATPRLETW